jgi:adenylate cyclase
LREEFDLPFFVCVPVMVARAPIGLLLSGRMKEARPLYPPLDQGDVDTFQAIAGLVSASVQNMRVAVLTEMDRLKTSSLPNISHELRTPIALTLGPLQQILANRHGEVSQSVRGPLNMMLRNQERLLVLINQILDLAKFEGGGMQLRAAPVANVTHFIEERVGQFQAIAEKRGLELKLSFDPRLRDASLYVDTEKLDRLVSNLLSNAVKFTKVGAIEVVTLLEDGAFRLLVSDTGIGIKADELPHIFDRFRQADGSVSREYAGTGIGLALVKEIATLHGGTVAVRSQYGEGTTFDVTVPLGKAHLSPVSVIEFNEEEAGQVVSPHALVVEEDPVNQENIEESNRHVEAGFDPPTDNPVRRRQRGLTHLCQPAARGPIQRLPCRGRS